MLGGVRSALLGGGTRFSQYALALDFKNGWYKGSNGLLVRDPTLLPGYTYTRSGAKSEVASNGTIYPFAANVPGIVPGDGYWSRGALTNLAVRSQEFDNASWLKLNTGTGVVPVVTANYATAPDGTLTADRIQFDLGATPAGATSRLFQSVTGGTNPNTPAIWLKTADGSTKSLYLIQTAGGPLLITVTGAWQRFQTGATTITQIQFGLTGTSGALSGVTTDTTADILAWQGSVVNGTQPGPIIVTAGATASLGADSLQYTYVPVDEDFIFWSTVNFQDVFGVQTRFAALVISGAERLLLERTTAGALSAFHATSASGATNLATGASQLTAGRAVMLVRHRAGKFMSAGKNSSGTVSLGTDTTLNMPVGMNLLQAGNYSSGNQPNAPVENVFIRRGSFSDADITNLLAAA